MFESGLRTIAYEKLSHRLGGFFFGLNSVHGSFFAAWLSLGHLFLLR